jgi:hypothetical protein
LIAGDIFFQLPEKETNRIFLSTSN